METPVSLFLFRWKKTEQITGRLFGLFINIIFQFVYTVPYEQDVFPAFYHSIRHVPQVRPPPKPDKMILSPLWSIPFRFTSSSKIGTLAADTFPQ